MPATANKKEGSAHADDLVDALNRHETRSIFSASKLKNTFYAASAKSVSSVSSWVSRKKRAVVSEEEMQLNERLLEELRAHLAPGFDPVVVQDELSHYTMAEKYSMLKEFETEAAERRATASVQDVVALLKQPMALTAADAKVIEASISCGNSEWVDEFVTAGGIEWLVECLRFSTFWCRSLNRMEAATAAAVVRNTAKKRPGAKTPDSVAGTDGSAQAFPGIKLEIVPEGAEDEAQVAPAQTQHLQRLNSLFYAALNFLRKANVEQQARVLGDPSCLVGVLRCLDFVSRGLLCESFLLFAGMSVLSSGHRTAVVDSWEAVALPKQVFFRTSLLRELRKGRDFHLKLAYFTFSNVFILHCQTVSERWHTRHAYLPKKLIRKFVSFVSLYPDEGFAFQLSKFREELLEDVEVFKELAEANAAYLDVALPCWREVSSDAPLAPEDSDDEEIAQEPNDADLQLMPSQQIAAADAPVSEQGQANSDEVPKSSSETNPESESTADGAAVRSEPVPPPPPPGEAVSKAPSGGVAAPPPPPGGSGAPPPPPGPGPPPMGGLAGKKDPNRPTMRPFRVQKLNNVVGTVFEKNAVEELRDGFNWSHLERNFTKSTSKEAPAASLAKAAHERVAKGGHVSFLSHRGAQPTFSVQIILRGFSMNRKVPAGPDEIVKKLGEGDMEYFSTTELEKLASLFPRDLATGELKYPNEEEAAKAVSEEELSTYDNAERFMHSLYMLGNPADKLAVMIYTRTLPETVEEISEKLKLAKAVMERLQDQKVYDFLGVVVATANYMNNTCNEARGMDLRSIEKLSQVKAMDSSRSLLHVLIEMLVEKRPDLVPLDDLLEPRKDFSHASRAIAVLIELQKDLRRGLAAVRKAQDVAKEDVWASFEEAADNLSKEMDTLKEKMQYLGYTEAATNPQGFFSLWKSFLKTYSVARQWVEDKGQAKENFASSKKHELLHSAQSLAGVCKSKASDGPSARPLAIPSAISLLASSPDFFKTLRVSREDVCTFLPKEK